MVLTPETMESREGLMSHSMYRDIARMDKIQLGNYVRAAFTERSVANDETAHLPEPFWSYWFNMRKHGSSEDGRNPPGPAVFFTGVHYMIGAIARKSFTIGEDGEDQPDFSFRGRYRKVLKEILEECVSIENIPNDTQVQLARFAVEAVDCMQTVDEFNEDSWTFVKEGRRGGQSLAPPDYPQELTDDLQQLTKERVGLRRLVDTLIEDGRFGEIELKYD